MMSEPAVYLLVAIVLLTVGVAASLVPASQRRSTRIVRGFLCGGPT
jgi:hypothetical protein